MCLSRSTKVSIETLSINPDFYVGRRLEVSGIKIKPQGRITVFQGPEDMLSYYINYYINLFCLYNGKNKILLGIRGKAINLTTTEFGEFIFHGKWKYEGNIYFLLLRE